MELRGHVAGEVRLGIAGILATRLDAAAPRGDVGSGKVGQELVVIPQERVGD